MQLREKGWEGMWRARRDLAMGLPEPLPAAGDPRTLGMVLVRGNIQGVGRTQRIQCDRRKRF